MKKAIFFVAFLFLSFTLFSQYYLSETEDEAFQNIKNKEGKDVSIKRGVAQTGNKMLEWSDVLGDMHLLFTEGKSTVLFITPQSNDVLNMTISYFKKNAIEISDESWRQYAEGKIYNITLFHGNNGYVFSVTLHKE